ncbi:MAG: lipopolysaccharide biosynthesis protein [Flavobacteriales bacterium]
MGIIANQASRNSISILVGTIAGAINTLFVLPRAFNDHPEQWGIISILLAWGVILSQLFNNGAGNLIIRFLPKLSSSEQPKLLGLSMLLTSVGTLLFLISFGLFGEDIIGWISPGDAKVISNNVILLLVLTASLIFFSSFVGYVTAILKSTVVQFLQEVVLKMTYLLIAILYWQDCISYTSMLWALVLSYTLVAAFLVFYAFAMGFRISSPALLKNKTKYLTYSFYSILDRGANMIVSRLDILMIGIILGIESVAFYVLAFYIGAVTQMPQKSIMAIANPIAAKAIANKDDEDLKHVYQQSSRMQLLLGGGLFACIWVSISELMQLFPAKFQGAELVVLFIGLSKLFYMATGVSGGMIVYSEYYKKNLGLNIGLIVLTIVTNYFFLSSDYIDMGITGAAIATCITLAVYNIGKIIVIKRKFNLLPFSPKYWGAAAIIPICSMIYFIQLPLHPFFGIILKSGTCFVLFVALERMFNLAPEISQILPKWLTFRNKD